MFKKLLDDDHLEKDRLEDQMWRRQKRLESIQDEIRAKEIRRIRYEQKLAEAEKERMEAHALAKSLGIPVDEGTFSSV